MKKKILSIACLLISCCLHASQCGFSTNNTPEDILKNLLSGEYNTKFN